MANDTVSVSVRLLNGDVFQVNVPPRGDTTRLTRELQRAFPEVFRSETFEPTLSRILTDEQQEAEVSETDFTVIAEEDSFFCAMTPVPEEIALLDVYSAQAVHTTVRHNANSISTSMIPCETILLRLVRPDRVVQSPFKHHTVPFQSSMEYILLIGRTTCMRFHVDVMERNPNEGRIMEYPIKRFVESLPYALEQRMRIGENKVSVILSPTAIPKIIALVQSTWERTHIHDTVPSHLAPVHCPCGSVIKRSGMKAHYRTKKHRTYRESHPMDEEDDEKSNEMPAARAAAIYIDESDDDVEDMPPVEEYIQRLAALSLSTANRNAQS